jgi:hypothetical protein
VNSAAGEAKRLSIPNSRPSRHEKKAEFDEKQYED